MEETRYPIGSAGIRVTSSVVLPSQTHLNRFLYVLNSKNGKWSLPAGKLDAFEHPLDGATRETFEETGLTVAVKGMIGIWPFRSPNGNSILNFVYYGEIIEGNPVAQHKEGIEEVSYLSLRDVRDFYSKGKLTGRANLEPLELFLRNNRKYFPLDIVKPVLMD